MQVSQTVHTLITNSTTSHCCFKHESRSYFLCEGFSVAPSLSPGVADAWDPSSYPSSQSMSAGSTVPSARPRGVSPAAYLVLLPPLQVAMAPAAGVGDPVPLMFDRGSLHHVLSRGVIWSELPRKGVGVGAAIDARARVLTKKRWVRLGVA